MTNDEVAAFLTTEIPRLEKRLAHYEANSDHPDPEYRHGSRSFANKYRRELAIARLAMQAIGEPSHG